MEAEILTFVQMNRFILSLAFGILFFSACKTPEKGEKSSSSGSEFKKAAENGIYRSSYPQSFDLIHTKLELKPDWGSKQLYGRASITLRPHFYSSDSLVLDARGMELYEVELESDTENTELPYQYSNNKLNIKLDRLYSRQDTLTVIINYTARPELLPEGGSRAIRKDKGLYFINADGRNVYKPKQLWTQGETESNSVWFPTIEDPAQRMTQEIYLTVDSTLKTLSNGLLLSSINNPDGTRTDYWNQSFPLPPYLSMIAASNFAIVTDHWRGKEVNYYLDKNYEKYARMIFGNTPEMIEFFSDKLGVDYPWDKYTQVVVHDFVSGAMENNTAVVHGTNMLQDPREYKDYNYEDYISHELFHHWFGNLVTCESWANVTLNEGFATYGEYLWREYKYGREDADYLGQDDLELYLRTTKKEDAPLLRFHYKDREDVYDAISYQKGGRVLHMLRKLVGDDAFFTSLHNYLQKYKYSSVEIHQLRIEFEKVTGQDLNWFFEQWFFQAGKPSLNIFTSWNEENKEEKIVLQQTQDLDKNPLFRLPMDVDFYLAGKTERRKIVLDSLRQEYVFSFPSEPDLVNVDAEKMLLLDKKKENKSTSAWAFQFHYAPLYLDRYEAINALGKNYRINTPEAEIILEGLKDRSWNIRLTALEHIKELAVNAPEQVKDLLMDLAKNDSNSIVRLSAFEVLGEYFPYAELSSFFKASIPDPSYFVEASVFNIIARKDDDAALRLADTLEQDSGSAVLAELSAFYAEHPEKNRLAFFKRALNTNDAWARFGAINNFGKYLIPQSVPILREGSDLLLETGIYTNSRHSRNNCVAALIGIQNELQSRMKEIIKSGEHAPPKDGESKTVSRGQVDRIQIESLSKDLEEKIKTLENMSPGD